MGKHSKLQTNLEYATVRFLLSGLSLLPRSFAVGVGRGLGRIAYRVGGKLNRTGARNLELALPELSADERKHILRGCFDSLGRQLGEFSHFSKINPENIHRLIDCEGLENLAAARAQGRGVIIFSGHLGAWEMIGFALSILGYPVNLLARRVDNPKVERLIEQGRTRFGNQTIDKRTGMRSMLRTLNAGGTLGLLTDINMLAQEGIFVNFFGIPASTTFTLAKLALRTEAPVLPVFMLWHEQRRRFVLHINPPLDIMRTDVEEEDVRRLTAQFTKTIEDFIRRYPEQWLWIHKRWRTRPEGEPDFYKNAE